MRFVPLYHHYWYWQLRSPLISWTISSSSSSESFSSSFLVISSHPAFLKLTSRITATGQSRSLFPLILCPSSPPHSRKLMLVNWVHTVRACCLTPGSTHYSLALNRACLGETPPVIWLVIRQPPVDYLCRPYVRGPTTQQSLLNWTFRDPTGIRVMRG